MVRRAALYVLVSACMLLVAPRWAVAASPTAAEFEQAMQTAMGVVDAHKAGEYETAAAKGKAALDVLAPVAGWEEEAVRAIAGVTIDSLEKLGRNAEADEIWARARAATTPAD